MNTSFSALQVQAWLDRLPFALTPEKYDQLARYLRLLYRWNAKMNLTAVRDPRIFASMHLLECLICGEMLPSSAATALDIGSGAGLPGIPVQICRPDLQVTLVESQLKKASFLREAARELRLPQLKVYAGRVEDMPAVECFDVVTLRAVDSMRTALLAAFPRIGVSGTCVILTSNRELPRVRELLPEIKWDSPLPISGTSQRVILMGRKPQ